jgi:hypothetical protein
MKKRTLANILTDIALEAQEVEAKFLDDEFTDLLMMAAKEGAWALHADWVDLGYDESSLPALIGWTDDNDLDLEINGTTISIRWD